MRGAYSFKNLNMGRELDISATFIYRGIKEFDALYSFREECDIFHILYDLAVGIERIQKILLVMFSNISDTSLVVDIENLEKGLITHSHQELHKRIAIMTDIKFSSAQNAFLQMLTQFYTSCRYDRYTFNGGFTRERELLSSFLSAQLGIEIITTGHMRDTPNDEKIKRFFLKVVGSISRTYYRYIENQSYGLGLFTHEKRYDSAAYKLFLGEYPNDSFYELIINERIAVSEFFIYLLKRKSEEDLMKLLYKTPSLDLDLNEIEIFFNGIAKGNISSMLIDSVENSYDDLDNKKDRINLMLALHNQ